MPPLRLHLCFNVGLLPYLAPDAGLLLLLLLLCPDEAHLDD